MCPVGERHADPRAGVREGAEDTQTRGVACAETRLFPHSILAAPRLTAAIAAIRASLIAAFSLDAYTCAYTRAFASSLYLHAYTRSPYPSLLLPPGIPVSSAALLPSFFIPYHLFA